MRVPQRFSVWLSPITCSGNKQRSIYKILKKRLRFSGPFLFAIIAIALEHANYILKYSKDTILTGEGQMKRHYIFLAIFALMAFSIIIITCSTATKPEGDVSTYYKRDYDYLDRTFFWLFYPEDSVVKIIDARIYVFQPKNSPAEPDLIVYDAQVAVDPANYGQFADEDRLTSVKELTPDTYNIYKNNLYLEMITFDRTRIIAGWFEVETTSGDTVQVGNIENDTLELKLISLDQHESGPDKQTFINEWRNVYSLGIRDVDPQNLQVQIHIGEPGTENEGDENPDSQDGFKFITLLGIDRMGYDYTPYPDGRADLFDSAIFWPDKGYLFFPEMKPFDPESTYSDIPLEITVPDIYNMRRSTITVNPLAHTVYYLEFKYAQ